MSSRWNHHKAKHDGAPERKKKKTNAEYQAVWREKKRTAEKEETLAWAREQANIKVCCEEIVSTGLKGWKGHQKRHPYCVEAVHAIADCLRARREARAEIVAKREHEVACELVGDDPEATTTDCALGLRERVDISIRNSTAAKYIYPKRNMPIDTHGESVKSLAARVAKLGVGVQEAIELRKGQDPTLAADEKILFGQKN